MRCYIETTRIPHKPCHDDEWIADIFTERDFNEGAPHSYIYRTPRMPSVSLAREAAEKVAEDMLLQVVPIHVIAG